MTHIIWILGILILAALPFGCESYRDNSIDQQQQEEAVKKEAAQKPIQPKMPDRSTNTRR